MNTQQYLQQLEKERIHTVALLNRLPQPCVDSDEARTREQLWIKLYRVEAAQHRLATSRYGKCQLCAMNIEAERLTILPYAELCFSCQRQLEKRTLSSQRCNGSPPRLTA